MTDPFSPVTIPLKTTAHVRAQFKAEAALRGQTMNALIVQAACAQLGIPLADLDGPHPAPRPLGAREQVTPAVRRFANDRCEQGPEFTVPTGELYRAFLTHPAAQDVPAVAKNVFGMVLPLACPGVHAARARRGGRLTYVYRGIRLRPPVTSP